MTVPYVFGGRLVWGTPLEGLRVGGSIETVRLDTTAFIPGIDPVVIENRSLLWVASAEYQVADLTLTAEYSRWFTKQRSNQAAVSPPIDALSERAYVMASYRLADWFHPGAYGSLFVPDVHDRGGREDRQFDVAATFRFDINPFWLVKLEGHYMAGTAGLLNPLRAPEQPRHDGQSDVPPGCVSEEGQALAERGRHPSGRSGFAIARAARFSEDVLGRSVAAVKAYWQQRIFSGRDVPPPELDADDKVLAYVLRHEGAVGYVSAAAELRGAKVVGVSR